MAERKVTSKALAERLGMSKISVDSWRTGTRRPREIQRIAIERVTRQIEIDQGVSAEHARGVTAISWIRELAASLTVAGRAA